MLKNWFWNLFFFFQAVDGRRDLGRSRRLGEVYKRQHLHGIGARLDLGWVEARPDAVQVMTVYAAKGLELSLIHILRC